MTIHHPEKINDIANTMIGIYQQQGKLPVWHLWGNETDCMVGNPGVIALADILVKGFEGFDKELAYKALKDSEMRPDRGQDIRMKYGFIPADKNFDESVAYDMEYAIADGAMAQAAKFMNNEADYNYFINRSHSYRNYFDQKTLFIRGKNADGKFIEPFNPYRSEHRADVYCEGNAWQYTWLAPQDFDGLVNSMVQRPSSRRGLTACSLPRAKSWATTSPATFPASSASTLMAMSLATTSSTSTRWPTSHGRPPTSLRASSRSSISMILTVSRAMRM